MSHSSSGAILVTTVDRGATLLPALARLQPRLQWQLYTSVAPAVFKACGGGFDTVVVDGDHAGDGFEQWLLQIARCVPSTRLLVLARDPRDARHAAVAACGWLRLVGSGTLQDALGAPA
ncbi:hypothetical protein [Azohydromonas lata]|uniref:hypothetical protein n=1 Tax=Azohydromonas lata TaxID=45677 RepID=UPI000835A8C5|nr:hypothetical protein [Azohydromonas lata]